MECNKVSELALRYERSNPNASTQEVFQYIKRHFEGVPAVETPPSATNSDYGTNQDPPTWGSTASPYPGYPPQGQISTGTHSTYPPTSDAQWFTRN